MVKRTIKLGKFLKSDSQLGCLDPCVQNFLHLRAKVFRKSVDRGGSGEEYSRSTAQSWHSNPEQGMAGSMCAACFYCIRPSTSCQRSVCNTTRQRLEAVLGLTFFMMAGLGPAGTPLERPFQEEDVPGPDIFSGGLVGESAARVP